MNGFVLIDKPIGPTSFAVVKTVRRMFGAKKAGHSGTLDPMATGLLIVALGIAPRLLPLLPTSPKRYRFGIQFGSETDTLDCEGVVVAQGERIPLQSEITSILSQFTGSIKQTPPKFSAVKVHGQRAFDLARNNQEFELQEKDVFIYSLDLLHYDESTGVALCEAQCSGGTYIRSLAKDIAKSLGTIAYASSIRRLSIGSLSVEKAIAFDELNAQETGSHIVSIKDALCDTPAVIVDEKQCELLVHGRDIIIDTLNFAKVNQPVLAFKDNGDLAAVLENKEPGVYHPVKVFLDLSLFDLTPPAPSPIGRGGENAV